MFVSLFAITACYPSLVVKIILNHDFSNFLGSIVLNLDDSKMNIANLVMGFEIVLRFFISNGIFIHSSVEDEAKTEDQPDGDLQIAQKQLMDMFEPSTPSTRLALKKEF
jgi:hypothetical protein